jgi:hypothetical protein
MSIRGSLIAGIIVLTATGSGTAEFTTPSLDQWGDGVKRIGPRKQVAVESHTNAAWVAPSSIALVSGAPVALHTLSPDTTTNIAAGEELTLRWAYTRPAAPYDLYYGSAPVAYETSGGMAMPRAAVTPTGAVVTAPGLVVTAPGPAVTPSGVVVTAPGAVVETPGAVVVPPSTVVSTPGTIVSTPGAVISTPGTVVATPGAVVSAPSVTVAVPGTVVAAPWGETYAREIEVPGQRTVGVMVDEGPWSTLSPGTVRIIREGTYTQTIVTPSGVIVR